MSKGLQYYLARLNPDMITVARELRSLSKKELAEKIGKSPSAVTKMEQGTLVPELDTFFTISRILNVEPAFFSRQTTETTKLDLTTCFFRSARTVSLGEKRRTTRLGSFAFEILEYFESLGVKFPKDKISPLADISKTYSTEDIERIALNVRLKLEIGSGPISNLTRTLEKNGVFVVNLIGEEFEKVDAFSTKINGRPVMLLCYSKPASRLLFDLAHELGHLILHDEDSMRNANEEKEANRFASAFLMPWKTFSEECPKRWNLDAFLHMKKRWKISIAAMLYRARDLEIISYASYTRAVKRMSMLGYRKEEPGEPEKEKPVLFHQAIDLLQDKINIYDIQNVVPLSLGELERVIYNQCVPRELIEKISIKKTDNNDNILKLA